MRYLLCLVASCVLFSYAASPSAQAQDPPDKDLVAWWKLDEKEGQKAADSSPNHLDGTLVGGAKWRPGGGAVGGAIELDGNGAYVAMEKDKKGRFDITDRITVAAWIKVNKFDKKWQAMVTKGDTSWRLARDKDRDCVQFAFNAIPREQLLKGQIKVDDGQWHHVAGVYDGKTMYLYVDGKLDVSAATTTDIPVSDEPVLIGENAQAKGRFWNGLIDDVRVYHRALTAEEIGKIVQGAKKAEK